MYTYRDVYYSHLGLIGQRLKDQLPVWHGELRYTDPHILLKIGMTSKGTVRSRLLQWTNACKKPVVNLTPDRINELLSSLVARNPTLHALDDMNSSTKNLRGWPLQNLHNYQDGGFYNAPVLDNSRFSLKEKEKQIHQHLWHSYGRGFFYCMECDPKGARRHSEWFQVPIIELPGIMQYINSICDT